MFRLFKRDKESTSVIRERIQALNNKLWIILMTGRGFDLESRSKYCRGLDFFCLEYRVFSLDTIFGKREIVVNSNNLYYGYENLIKRDNNSLKWKINPNFIFRISVDNKDRVFLSPRPFTKMTKEEIDLAILEFEEAIDKIYYNIVELNKGHEEIIKFLKESI